MLKQKIYIFDNFSEVIQIICYGIENTSNDFPISNRYWKSSTCCVTAQIRLYVKYKRPTKVVWDIAIVDWAFNRLKNFLYVA